MILAHFKFSAIKHGFDLVVDRNPLIESIKDAHLALYLIWQRDSTTKSAKKNTPPNVIHLQYLKDTILSEMF